MGNNKIIRECNATMEKGVELGRKTYYIIIEEGEI
jgi:hypothetical protein